MYKKLASHNTEEDAWMAVDGMVYEITYYIRIHPGGRDVLLEHLGTDAS